MFMIGLFLLMLCVFPSFTTGEQPLSERIERLGNGRLIYLAWKGEKPKKKSPVLLALHGSGRSAESYGSGPGSIPFYTRQRDLAVQSGYLFAAVSNGRDAWGTDEGLEATAQLVSFVKEEYNVKEKWTVWASSAGGILLARLFREKPGLVDKALGTFPVYDLQHAFETLESAREAWRSATSVARVNPANYPNVFVNVPYLVFHGSDDKAVPLEKHSLRLRQEVNALGGKVDLKIVPGGHSTGNFALYDDSIITGFLKLK